MKRQSIGLVLCALLMSTFGHELLQRHQQARSARIARSSNNAAHSHQARSHLAPRGHTSAPSESEDCVVVCTKPCGDTAQNLTIIYNSKTGVIGVFNETSRILLVIDTKAQIVGIFDCHSHTAIIIDIKTHKGVSITFNDKRTAEQFIQEIHSLKDYLSAEGHKFDEHNVSENVLVRIRFALVVLSGGEFTTSGKEGFTLLIQISLRISVAFSTVIHVVDSSTVTGEVTLRGVLEVTEGLAEAVVLIGVEVLVKNNVKFSLTQVIAGGRVRSSVEIAVSILIELCGKGVDTSKITSTQASILLFIAAFGGNSTNGVTGVFQVVADIIGFIDKTVTIQTLIGVLIEYVVSNGDNQSLSKDFYTAINVTIKALQDAHGGASLQKVLAVLIKIRDHKLVEGGVDISAIIDVLVGYDGKTIPLVIVIRVLVLLKVVIDIRLALVNLFGHLIVLLVSGTVNILVFILAIEIEIGLNLVGEIIHALLAAGGNLLKFIRGISVLNQIFIQFSICVKAGGVDIEITSIFGQNGLIQVIVQILKSIGISIPSTPTSQPLKTLPPLGPGPVILPTPTKAPTKGSDSSGHSETGGDGHGGSGGSSKGGSGGSGNGGWSGGSGWGGLGGSSLGGLGGSGHGGGSEGNGYGGHGGSSKGGSGGSGHGGGSEGNGYGGHGGSSVGGSGGSGYGGSVEKKEGGSIKTRHFPVEHGKPIHHEEKKASHLGENRHHA